VSESRPRGSNADEWHLFLCQYLDNRATSPNGLTFMAVQIAEAIEEGRRDGLEHAAQECERHGKFCKDEAHKAGDFHHLITRHDEAVYNAKCIRGIANAIERGGP
jgi:hypothetical protein